MTQTLTIWAIDRDYISEGDESNRVGFGQTVTDGDDTTASFDAVIGRTVHVSTTLKVASIPAEYRVRFKCLDDDGEVYYGGAVDIRALMDAEPFFTDDGETDAPDYAYGITRWAEADAGAIHTLFKRSDIVQSDNAKWSAFGERHPGAHADLGGNDWLPIYC